MSPGCRELALFFFLLVPTVNSHFASGLERLLLQLREGANNVLSIDKTHLAFGAKTKLGFQQSITALSLQLGLGETSLLGPLREELLPVAQSFQPRALRRALAWSNARARGVKVLSHVFGRLDGLKKPHACERTTLFREAIRPGLES